MGEAVNLGVGLSGGVGYRRAHVWLMLLSAYSEVLQMLLAQGVSQTSHTKSFQQLIQHDSKGLGTLDTCRLQTN